MLNVNRDYQKNCAPGTRAHKKEDFSVLLDHMYFQIVKIDCLDKVV